MLPLWIIDLREKTDCRDSFEYLVSQLDHVNVDTHIKKDSENKSDSTCVGDLVSNEEGKLEEVYCSDATSYEINSDDEKNEIKDKEKSERNSNIVGNYWRCSWMADEYYYINIKSNVSNSETNVAGNNDSGDVSNDTDINKETESEDEKRNNYAKDIASKLYKFQSNMVYEGQKFIQELRSSNAKPDLKINVAVLGDVTEDFTRIVFPSVAGMLQKEKGRILPHHIHQGMEIIGMLFVPCNINTYKPDIRRSIQRTLKEIDIQHQLSSIRGYDHVMLYQDVQNRTECSYPMMNKKQQAEYLVQCLSNLYLACNENHPLLSGTPAADVFYFSMGAASVYYDAENEDVTCRNKLAMEVIRYLKSSGDSERHKDALTLIDDDDYLPKQLLSTDGILEKIDVSEIEDKDPSPHPVRNCFAKHLKRYYYNQYLRFFTKEKIHNIISTIDSQTGSALDSVAVESKRKFTDAQKRTFDVLKEKIGQLEANDGGIPAIINMFKDMQNKISKLRSDIQPYIEKNFWSKIESDYVPECMEDRFFEYHDAYIKDVKEKNGGKNQMEMKRQVIKELNGLLSQESTTLGKICSSILLGIVCVLAFFPILCLLSPNAVDLGDVENNKLLWYPLLFMLPAIVQIVMIFRYQRNKKNAVNSLMAVYLHDSYARVTNRIESEINNFYNKLIELSNKYIGRCEDIRMELGKDYAKEEKDKQLLPDTMFNQPLVGGRFGNDSLLPQNEIEDGEIYINYGKHKLSEMSKTEYFLLINQNKNMISDLFRDVYICENLLRRVNDKGEEELLTKEQQENEQRKLWEKHRDDFHKQLRDTVKSALVQRENATIGDKLHNCCPNPEQNNILKPVVDYAATNGEITSSSDTEFIDAKINDKRVGGFISHHILSRNFLQQVDKYDDLYKKYIFITRWRCFEHFNFNRVLPMEDFDYKVRRQCIYDEEKKTQDQNKKQKSNAEKNQKSEYCARPSSLLLWSLCADDSSPEWFNLFDAEHFIDAHNDRDIYRQILNQND